jgi:chemotaxis protein MotB
MAKKKHEEEHENHERWLVSYADFITLLFAFFVILYATSAKDVSKAQEFQRSVQKAFRSYIDFGGLEGKYVSTNQATQLLPPPFDVVPQEGAGPNEMLDYVDRELQKELGEQDEKNIVDLRTDAQGVRVTVADSFLFDAGSALLKESALPKLDRMSKVFKKTRRKLIVEGYTDSQAIHTPLFPSNWELSASRACTLVRYLILQHAVDPNLLAAVGYADQHPLLPNDTPENRAKNRRIDVLIVTEQPKPRI